MKRTLHVENGKQVLLYYYHRKCPEHSPIYADDVFAQNLVKEKEVKGEREDAGSDVTEKLEKVKETLLETESRERERTGREGKEGREGRERCLRERSPSLHRQVVCRRRKPDTNTSSGASTCSEDSEHSNDTFGESRGKFVCLRIDTPTLWRCNCIASTVPRFICLCVHLDHSDLPVDGVFQERVVKLFSF